MITKLLLAKNFRIKVEFNVHKTTLEIMEEISKDEKILTLLKTGYKEFTNVLNDLTQAKKERTKAQYYTGTKLAKQRYTEKAPQFINKIVIPYLNKINLMLR